MCWSTVRCLCVRLCVCVSVCVCVWCVLNLPPQSILSPFNMFTRGRDKFLLLILLFHQLFDTVTLLQTGQSEEQVFAH